MRHVWGHDPLTRAAYSYTLERCTWTMYELVMHTEVWLRPQSEAGGEDGPLSLPVVPAGGDAASARANVTAPALRILDEQGLAQLGFAAGRSEVGLEQYEIHEWWFKRNVDGFHGEERLSRRDEKVV